MRDRSAPRRDWSGPKRAQFPFVDLATGQRWQLDLGDGRLPLWVFDAARRVPDTGLLDYLALMPLIWAAPDKLVGDTIPCQGTLYQRLVQPLLLAALNVDPPEGSAGLAGAVVRETLLAGGQACRPLIARDGLERGSGRTRDQAAAGQGRQHPVRA